MEVRKDYLTPNPWSRPGKQIKDVKAVVLHWVANPNQEAESVRDWFELKEDGQHGYGSAHYIVGLEGEIIQCIPEKEIAYHVGSDSYTDYARYKFGDWAVSSSGSPNYFAIGIELCHVNWEGFFTEKTLESAKKLCVDLCKKYSLHTLDVTTHHNIVGWKDCPQWFIDSPEDFQLFQEKLRKAMGE